MIAQSFIEDLLGRVDIVDLIGRYVPLKKNGANFSGLCPFHNEKSPSFTVSPTKQFYHCFGCSANGTAIGFLIEYSGLGFVEAVQELAQGVGIQVPERSDALPPEQRAALQAKSVALADVMTQATDFYCSTLRTDQRASSYLGGRGLSAEIISRFSIGYAPDEWTGLRQIFANYQMPVLEEAGLVIDRSDASAGPQKRYDRFRDRIMFPIRNLKGQVIAFGGRVLDRGEPKYLNSPETPLFQKGQELYGLFEARQAIRDAGYVLVTEGYMDVVALAQFGFAQVVATLGTACTAVHVQKLLRHADQVIFSFDGDAAGRRAARRALEACLPYASDNKTLRFLFLPVEHDPDSYIRLLGAEAFEQQVQHALPLSQFLLNELTAERDLQTAEGRARVQFDAKTLIQALPPSALRLQIVRNLAQVTHTSVSELENAFELRQPVSAARNQPARAKRSAPPGLQRQMMRLLLAHPILINELTDADLAALGSPTDSGVMLTQLLTTGREMGEQASFAALAERLRAAEFDFDSVIAEIAAESDMELSAARLELTGALRQFRMKTLKAELAQLAAAGLQTDEAKQRFRQLFQQQEQLRRAMEDELAER